jgi:hypothetical protein
MRLGLIRAIRRIPRYSSLAPEVQLSLIQRSTPVPVPKNTRVDLELKLGKPIRYLSLTVQLNPSAKNFTEADCSLEPERTGSNEYYGTCLAREH